MASTPSPSGVSFQNLRNWASARAHRHRTPTAHQPSTPGQPPTVGTPVPARARDVFAVERGGRMVAAAAEADREGEAEREEAHGQGFAGYHAQAERIAADTTSSPWAPEMQAQTQMHQQDGDVTEDEDGDEQDEDEEGDAPALEDDDTEGVDEDEDDDAGVEEVPMDLDPPFDPYALGLKEVGSLASWTVSTCKPGCGVEALRDDDTTLFWQSDGPQPHHLNIHFSRLVSIRAIRIFLDFEADESYTPTRMTLLAGTGYHDLIPFSALNFAQPKGWIDVPLTHVGGGPDGKTLRAFLVQVKVVENHQNGKDTHMRGVKIYVADERGPKVGAGLPVEPWISQAPDQSPALVVGRTRGADKPWLELDWMDEPQIR